MSSRRQALIPTAPAGTRAGRTTGAVVGCSGGSLVPRLPVRAQQPETKNLPTKRPGDQQLSVERGELAVQARLRVVGLAQPVLQAGRGNRRMGAIEMLESLTAEDV